MVLVSSLNALGAHAAIAVFLGGEYVWLPDSTTSRTALSTTVQEKSRFPSRSENARIIRFHGYPETRRLTNARTQFAHRSGWSALRCGTIDRSNTLAQKHVILRPPPS